MCGINTQLNITLEPPQPDTRSADDKDYGSETHV